MTDRNYTVGVRVEADVKSASAQLGQLEQAEAKLGERGRELAAAASGLSSQLDHLGNQNAAIEAFRSTAEASTRAAEKLDASTTALRSAEAEQQRFARNADAVQQALDRQRTATAQITSGIDQLKLQLVEAKARSAEYAAAAKAAGDGDDYLRLKADLAKQEVKALSAEVKAQDASFREAVKTQRQLETALKDDQAAADRAQASVAKLGKTNTDLAERSREAATAQQAAADKLAGYGIETAQVDAAQQRLAEQLRSVQGRVSALSTEFRSQASAAGAVEAAYAELGVTSTASLQRAANAARQAFGTLRASGVASAADLDAAFESVARAELKVAVAASEAQARVVAARLAEEAATDAQRAALQRLQAEYLRSGDAGAAAAAKSREGLSLVRDVALSLAGISIGAELVKQLTEIADEARNVDSRLRLATAGSEEFVAAQADVFRIAQQTGTAFASTAETYYKLNQAVKSLGGTGDDTATVLTAVNQAVTLSGVSSQSASDGLIQFAQGLASGRLQGDELRSVLENLPALASALAQGLGVTTAELRQLGEQGALTPQQLLAALEKVAPQIADQFATVPATVGRALSGLRNSFVVAVGAIDETTNASSSLASGIEALASVIDKLGSSGRVRDAFNAIGSLFRTLVVDPLSIGGNAIGLVFSSLEAAIDGAASGIALALSKITFGETSRQFAIAADSLAQDAEAAAERAGKAAQRIGTDFSQLGTDAVDTLGATVGALGGLSADSETAATRVGAANRQAGKSFLGLKDTSGEVSQALLQTLSPAVSELVKQYGAAGAAGGAAAKSATGFADEAKRLGLSAQDAVRGLAALDAAGKITAQNFDEQLGKVLKEVSDQDLPRLSRALSNDYRVAAAGASDTTTQLRSALDALRVESLARLGIDAKAAISGVSKEVDAAALAIRTLGGNATTSGAEIQLAFDTALSKVRTRQDAQAIAAAIDGIRIEGFNAEAAVRQLQTRLQGLAAESPGLQRVEAALQRLGVTSQQSLDAAAAAAKADFAQIAASGTQSAGVLNAAFAKTAEAQLAAAAAQGQAALSTAEQQLLAIARTEAQRDTVTELTARYADQSGILKQIAADARTAAEEEQQLAEQRLRLQQQVVESNERIQEQQQLIAENERRAAAANAFAIANLIGQAEDYYKKISDGALAAFQRIVAGASIYGDSVLNFFSNVARGQAQLDRQIAEQRVGAERMLETLGSVYGATYNNLVLAQQTAESFRYLDQQTLSQLNSAISRVQSNLNGLRDSARSAVASLQDELDQLEGNQDAIQKRRDDAKRAEIEAQLEAARTAGDRQAIADLQRALDLLNQIARVRQQQADAERNSRNGAATPAPAQAPASTPASTPAQSQAPAPPASGIASRPAASSAAASGVTPVLPVRVVRFEFTGRPPLAVVEDDAPAFESLIAELIASRRIST